MRRPLVAATAALALILLVACDGSDSPQAMPANPLLLKAKDLDGAAETAKLRTGDLASPTLCGPDSEIIRQGAGRRDFAAFTRADERIVVGAWEHPGDIDLWLDDMTKKAQDPTCREGSAGKPVTSRWTVDGILTDAADTAAFTWTQWAVDGDENGATVPTTPSAGDGLMATSGARAYRRLGNHVVMASISNTTTTPPTPDQLEAVLDREAKLVDTTPGVAGPDACGLLEDKQVRAALGAKPRTILDESTDREVAATNTLACRYLGSGGAHLTFSGHREKSAAVARARLDDERTTCSGAEALDMTGMAIPRGTGFVCPAAGDGPVTAHLEWMSILLRIELTSAGDATPSEAAELIRSVAADLNRAMTFDAFGS